MARRSSQVVEQRPVDQRLVDDLVQEIDGALRAAGNPERAVEVQRYLKSQLTFYGAGVPAVRAAAKRVRKAHPALARPTAVALAEALWREPIHERRMAAIELLALYQDRLDPADMALLERLLRESKTWALIDALSANVAGGMVERHPELCAVLDRWATDPDFWIRRSALLALLVPLRNGGGDFERFGRYADAMLEEKEFFIRKAIGWVLRDTGKKTPDRVAAWLAPRAARASGLTLREATKHLPEGTRRRLLGER